MIEELGIGNAKRIIQNPDSRTQLESLTLKRYAILDVAMLERYLASYCEQHGIDMKDVKITYPK